MGGGDFRVWGRLAERFAGLSDAIYASTTASSR